MCLDFCCPSFQPRYYQSTPQYVPVPRVVFEGQRIPRYKRLRLFPTVFDSVVNASIPVPPTSKGRVIPGHGSGNVFGNALPLNGRVNLPSGMDSLRVPVGERMGGVTFRAPVIAPGHSKIESGRIRQY